MAVGVLIKSRFRANMLYRRSNNFRNFQTENVNLHQKLSIFLIDSIFINFRLSRTFIIL